MGDYHGGVITMSRKFKNMVQFQVLTNSGVHKIRYVVHHIKNISIFPVSPDSDAHYLAINGASYRMSKSQAHATFNYITNAVEAYYNGE